MIFVWLRASLYVLSFFLSVCLCGLHRTFSACSRSGMLYAVCCMLAWQADWKSIAWLNCIDELACYRGWLGVVMLQKMELIANS